MNKLCQCLVVGVAILAGSASSTIAQGFNSVSSAESARPPAAVSGSATPAVESAPAAPAGTAAQGFQSVSSVAAHAPAVASTQETLSTPEAGSAEAPQSPTAAQSTVVAVAAGGAFASTGSGVSAPAAEAATHGVGVGSSAALESAATGGAAPDMTPEASVSSAASATTAPAGFTSISSAGSASAAGSAEPVPSPVEASAVAPRDRADRILVKKGERKLYLLRADDVVAEYPIRLGLNPYGPKQREGDFRTPEGVYHLSRRNPDSNFYLSLEVSYPNFADRARARATGVQPGGLIMIHGQPNDPRKSAEYYASNDWTDGCIAVSNADMRDIWMRTDVGIPIEIRP